jgi:hypothetical protein
MSYEDLVTMSTFLRALKNLEQPLPEKLQTDLGRITETLDRQLKQVPHQTDKLPLLTEDLGWTPEQVMEARSHLLSFEEDWKAPGMEIYDEL